jgi:hypothetical protein
VAKIADYGYLNGALGVGCNTTRNTFKWNNYVGDDFSSQVTPTEYPYRWDLCLQEDTRGSWVKYAYEQVKEPLVSATYNSGGMQSTKASDLKEIVVFSPASPTANPIKKFELYYTLFNNAIEPCFHKSLLTRIDECSSECYSSLSELEFTE